MELILVLLLFLIVVQSERSHSVAQIQHHFVYFELNEERVFSARSRQTKCARDYHACSPGHSQSPFGTHFMERPR